LTASYAPTTPPQTQRPHRLLSSFFDSTGLDVGPQGLYESPAAAFDKDARRFVLATVSQAAPGSGSGGSNGGNAAAAAAAAASVLWLGASQKTDPRQSWRMVALPAPAAGSPDNPCGADRVAV
jgi:hypothetical protein